MPDPIALRRAGPADAAAITALTRAAYTKWIAVAGREPLPMQVDYADALIRHRFDLLHEGDDLVALIETTPADDLLLIVNVAVDPARQARGLGRRLLAHAETLSAAAGLAGMRLYTNRLFEANLRLYAALGYVVEREETLARGVVVHMTKRFAA